MSDLKLLPPEQPTQLEQLLLRAASAEAPSATQRERVRQALGLPSPLLAPPLPAAARFALPLKVLGGVAVLGAVALWGLTRREAPPATTRLRSQVSAPAPVVRAPVVDAPSSGVSALVPSAQEAVAPPVHAAARKQAPVVENGADLGEQLRLIETARASVAAGKANAATAALTTYANRFPRGSFSQEASVLLIQTLDLQGEHAQASARARSFLARHPNSPHVSLVQRIANRAH